MEPQIKQIIADILDVDKAAINDNFGPKILPTWDSINNLRLVTAIEDEFQIKLSMDDIKQMINFKSIKETVARYV